MLFLLLLLVVPLLGCESFSEMRLGWALTNTLHPNAVVILPRWSKWGKPCRSVGKWVCSLLNSRREMIKSLCPHPLWAQWKTLRIRLCCQCGHHYSPGLMIQHFTSDNRKVPLCFPPKQSSSIIELLVQKKRATNPLSKSNNYWIPIKRGSHVSTVKFKCALG